MSLLAAAIVTHAVDVMWGWQPEGAEFEQAQVLVPGGCVAGEFGDDRSYQDTGGADAFVVAGLGGHVGEHLTQVGSGMAYPSGLGIELHQLLGDDQAQ